MKPKRIQVEVRPGKVWDLVHMRVTGGWHVLVGGALHEAHSGKSGAVWFARAIAHELADEGQLAELTIKGRNGRIQDRRTYPRSSDPRRSKG